MITGGYGSVLISLSLSPSLSFSLFLSLSFSLFLSPSLSHSLSLSLSLSLTLYCTTLIKYKKMLAVVSRALAFLFFQKEPLTFGVKRGAVGCRVSRGECEQLRGVISQAPISPPPSSKNPPPPPLSCPLIGPDSRHRRGPGFWGTPTGERPRLQGGSPRD